ncbi:ACP S-malonyltransferase [Streptomyces sp. NPDC092296]|uniref:ACP S-malonyltransferase n=1 Tax=Streptomyces sp. NPDC092296 TaxID=3366012 RepID=UPI00380B2837
MLVLVAPGQGAQTPGFLAPWLEVDGVADRLHWWSAVAGLDLVHYGTEASAEEIKDTAVAQPLLVAAGLVAVRALLADVAPADGYGPVGAVAGHSVGEITTAAVAGVLSDESAMAFVRQRGLAMADAAAVTETGMSVLLGGDPDEVAAKLAEHGLTAANNNGGGQLVAAGTLEQLAALKADPPAAARLVALSVAGAFHTHHMAPGVAALGRLAPGMPVGDPRVAYVSNRDGGVVDSGAEVLSRLVSQVSNPVRWDLCMETLRELGATCVIEVPPAGTLTNLVKRNLKGVETLALKTPADLDKARELVAKHGEPIRLPATEGVNA